MGDYYKISPKYDRFGNKLHNGKHDKFWDILKIIILILLVYFLCIRGVHIGNKVYWIRPSSFGFHRNVFQNL